MASPTKAQLLAQAQDLGLELNSENTVAEISAAINAHLDQQPTPEPEAPAEAPEAPVDGEIDETRSTGDDQSTPTEDGADFFEQKAEVESIVEDINTPEVAPPQDLVNPVEAPAPRPIITQAPAPEVPAPEANAGNAIAEAITAGLTNAAEASKKKIKIVSDPSVQPRFSRVRNQQGETMIRDNVSGRLSKLQLQSIEEKDKSIQNQEVEEL